MHARGPTETTHRDRTTRRDLIVRGALTLALALALCIAGAASALAATTSSERDRRPAHGATATTPGPLAADDRPEPGAGGVSPVVPLVLAGIVILAASGPWLPQRYVYDRFGRRW